MSIVLIRPRLLGVTPLRKTPTVTATKTILLVISAPASWISILLIRSFFLRLIMHSHFVLIIVKLSCLVLFQLFGCDFCRLRPRICMIPSLTFSANKLSELALPKTMSPIVLLLRTMRNLAMWLRTMDFYFLLHPP